MRTRITMLAALTLLAMAAPPDASAQIAAEVEVAQGIVDRMPEGAGTAFPTDVGTVYCWMRVTGAEGEILRHVWIHGETEFPVELTVGGSPWRTWSSKSIPPEWSGDWRVEVRDGDGNLLETVSFTVGT